MTFANNLDPDEAPQNVGLHLRSKMFDILIVYQQKKMGGNFINQFATVLWGGSKLVQHANRLYVVLWGKIRSRDRALNSGDCHRFQHLISSNFFIKVQTLTVQSVKYKYNTMESSKVTESKLENPNLQT